MLIEQSPGNIGNLREVHPAVGLVLRWIATRPDPPVGVGADVATIFKNPTLVLVLGATRPAASTGAWSVSCFLARNSRVYLERLTKECTAAGMIERDAMEAARRALGGIAITAEQCRDTRRVRFLEDFAKDPRTP